MKLIVQIREKLGKAVKSLRREGLIPAELYGRGRENAHLSVPAKEFLKVYKEAGTNTIVNLRFGEEDLPVLIYNVGRNYLTDEADHVDFYAVRMDEKIKAKIPIEFLGVAPAVKDKGGVLNKSMSEIEVEALPGDLPHKFEVDLSVLDDLNKSIYVKDVKVPKGVEVLVESETPIVTVTPPVPEEEEKPEEPVDLNAVKVEGEEKKIAREKGKEEKKEGSQSA